MNDQSFVCSTCGQRHPGLPTDYGFRLPDEVHALGYVNRYLRSRSNADLCTLDEGRYFLRGVLPIPLIEAKDDFCWGVWVEVDETTHDTYAHGFESDLSGQPGFPGRLANNLPGYGGTVGLAVDIRFQDEGTRPLLEFPPCSAHALAHEQHNGISNRRHHDLLESVGFFKKKDDA